MARGTVQEFLDADALRPSSEAEGRLVRLGVLAAIVVNQLVEFIYKARCDLRRPMNEPWGAFRERLAKECCRDLPLLEAVAVAAKHPHLVPRHQIHLSGIEAVRPGHPQVLGRDGDPVQGRDGDPVRERRLAVVVDTQNGEKELVDIMRECWPALEKLIAAPRPVP